MFAMPDAAASPVPILIADDDEEDRMLARDVLEESRLANSLFFVHDGVELTFDGLVDVMRLLATYWFEIVDLAPGSG
jgi:CheY-like chemotaxis protein